MISKKIFFHAPTKRNNKSFRYAMPKIQITNKYGSVKVGEGNRSILGALNSDSLTTRKPADIKKVLSYCLSTVPSSICNSDGILGRTTKSKLKDILLQDLKDHIKKGPQSLQEKTVVNMFALINTIFNKSSTYAEFT